MERTTGIEELASALEVSVESIRDVGHRKGIMAASSAFWEHLASEDGEDAEAAIQAYLSASNQVLAPMEPTKRMLVAGVRGEDISETAYRYKAMLRFAPNPFKDK